MNVPELMNIPIDIYKNDVRKHLVRTKADKKWTFQFKGNVLAPLSARRDKQQ